MSFSHRVGVAANIAIIVTCAVLVTFVAVVARDRVASPPLPNPYQVGNVFAEVTPATQDTEARVVVCRTTCVRAATVPTFIEHSRSVLSTLEGCAS